MAERRLSDPRTNLFGLVATDHSATLLGTSLTRLIESQREYLPPEAYTRFVAFAGRDAADRSLRSMGLAAYGSTADFRYGSGPTT